MIFPIMSRGTIGKIQREARPRIGITMRVELSSDRFYLGRFYSEAVEAAGGIPVHISLIPNPDYISNIMDSIDGVLLPGSDSDVDPLRYGTQPHPQLGTVVPVKDETDLLVLQEIDRRNLPLLAICFGMQILNVSRGGTLIQDIATQWPGAIKHEQGPPRDRPSHQVRFSNESLLATLAASDSTLVNSFHHQAIENVGADLKATAWSTDGLIEAVEDPRPDHYVVGVQWHPEIGWEKDLLSQAIFKDFVSACSRDRFAAVDSLAASQK
jgi:putative glutamine amidotransferase